MKKGLVLEGGGMRGMFTAGILDVFLREKIRMDAVVGVSAGTLFGVNYPSGQTGRALRYNKKYCRSPRYMGTLSLIFTGDIVNKKFAYYKVPVKLDPFDQRAFRASKIDFWSVSTDVEDGMPQYTKIADVFEQMEDLRASGSMPYVSRYVEIGGRKYLDGGITDSIPVNFCRSIGCEKTVVILTRPTNYRKKPLTGIVMKINKLKYGKYPKLVEALNTRNIRYNRQVEEILELEKKGEIFVIRPSEPINIKRTEKNPKMLEKVYEMGIKEGERSLEELLKYLEE